MKNPLYFQLIVIAVFFASLPFSHNTYAQCNIIGVTPGGGDEVVCTGTDNNGFSGTSNPDSVTIQPGADVSRAGAAVIELMGANDTIIMNGGTVTRTDGGNGLDGGLENDTFIINGGDVFATFAINGSSGDDDVTISDGNLNGEINLSSDNDTLTMSGGTITTDRAAINCASGDDVIILTGGVVTGGTDGTGDGINGSGGADTITVSNATLTGGSSSRAINASSDNDLITLGTGAVINGLIDCGFDDFDILTFAMEVPANLIGGISVLLATKDPAGDSITINGLFYEWEDCELIVNELVIIPPVTNVPTMSQWGLIAMAGLLGIVGFMVIRQRKATA